MEITRAADVREILGDPAFVVPPVPPAGAPGGVTWLRASVGRFCNGEQHEHRRGLGVAALAVIDTAGLRRDACARAETLLRGTGRKPFDVVARIARPATVDTLAAALGIPGATAVDVALAARAYHPQAAFDKRSDRAVAQLVAACGGAADERTAMLIGLLVQACDATAGLVANALVALLSGARSGSPEEIVAVTLRDDPPVRGTRRVAQSATRAGDDEVAAGTVVVLDLTSARDERLPFGAGPRQCPGREQALALAAGIVEACRGCRLAESEIDLAPPLNLRSPGSLLLLR